MVNGPLIWAVLAGAVVAVGECLHRQRCKRAAALAFGPGGRAARWAGWAPLLRVVFVATAAWGFATTTEVRDEPPDAGGPSSSAHGRRVKQLLIVLDVSGSMALEDGGPGGERRLEWAGAQLWELMSRVPATGFRTTVLAVSTGMRPVVVETEDLGVVRNVLDGLPLDQAFERRYTDLYGGIKAALMFSQRWPERSTTMVLISDGDTGPPQDLVRPDALNSVWVLGVGSSVGRTIGPYRSQQHCECLSHIKSGLRGEYINCSTTALPTTMLKSLASPIVLPVTGTITLLPAMAAAVGGAVLSFLPLALAAWGTSWLAGVRLAPQSWSRHHVQAGHWFARLLAAAWGVELHRGIRSARKNAGRPRAPRGQIG